MSHKTPVRPRCLQDFEGGWELIRRIEHADGTLARFEGLSIWAPDGDGLCQEESGVLRIGKAAPIVARRRYLWRPILSVHFDDGRFFHDVPSTGGKASHWCAPDQYDVTYDFAPWPEFRVTWQVSGPRKSYRMDSIYRRISA
ncbi:DUF6314 family protein [Sedimentitalea todarodis]|uniref:DUF6314 family protein n=1 Tax=Sedimentitalea todarodis TaxID=1631240 RepID=A0ABU3VBM4_9RHOB|nr:DUF6314 family protein [Sedimentitalea todarodis]MDU9003575.1 DUF6314 family protein [Sedimentitalea todarodis]